MSSNKDNCIRRLRRLWALEALSDEDKRRLLAIGFSPTPSSLCIPVICYETEERFDSMTSAANWVSKMAGTEVTVGSVSAAVKRGIAVRGYHFFLEGDESSFLKSRHSTRAVMCFETGERFISGREAAKAINVSDSTLYNAIKSRSICVGYHWYYEDEGSPEPTSLKVAYYRPSYSVICYETKDEFCSPSDAARWVGAKASSVRDACRSGKALKGFHFCYTHDLASFTPMNRREKKVRCVETSEVFNSAADADRSLGIRYGVAKAIRKKMKCRGYHWEYVSNDED